MLEIPEEQWRQTLPITQETKITLDSNCQLHSKIQKVSQRPFRKIRSSINVIYVLGPLAQGHRDARSLISFPTYLSEKR